MKAKRIAVYDRNGDDLATTAAAVQEYCSRLGVGAEVAEFSDPGTFLGELQKTRYDIAFLGVNNMRDMETAYSAANKNRRCLLFFVSDTLDYGAEGVRLKIADYLLKPVTYAAVWEAMARAEPDEDREETGSPPKGVLGAIIRRIKRRKPK